MDRNREKKTDVKEREMKESGRDIESKRQRRLEK